MHSHIAICRAWSQGNVVDFEFSERRAGNFYRAAFTIIDSRWALHGLRLSLEHLALAGLHLILLLVSLPDEIFLDWGQVTTAALCDTSRFVRSSLARGNLA